jgi:hypothetical protein
VWVAERAIHHELALGPEASPDVLEDEDIAVAGKVAVGNLELALVLFPDTVWCAVEQQR